VHGLASATLFSKVVDNAVTSVHLSAHLSDKRVIRGKRRRKRQSPRERLNVTKKISKIVASNRSTCVDTAGVNALIDRSNKSSDDHDPFEPVSKHSYINRRPRKIAS